MLTGMGSAAACFLAFAPLSAQLFAGTITGPEENRSGPPGRMFTAFSLVSNPPRSRSQHQLAAGVAQFELSVRLPHIVEGEDSGDQGSGCTVVLNKYGS